MLSIFMPAGQRQNYADTTESLYELGQALAAKGIKSRLRWFASTELIDIRNLALTLWFCKQKSPHLLMVDADMKFPAQLVLDMLAFDKPVTGTFYSRRDMSGTVVGHPIMDAKSRGDVIDGHLKVNGVGAGVLLIKRDAIVQMIEKRPDILDRAMMHSGADALQQNGVDCLIRAFDRIHVNGGLLSEDLSFCHLWRECGGEVWANVDHMIGHVGPVEFAIRYRDSIDETVNGDENPIRPYLPGVRQPGRPHQRAGAVR